MSGKQRVYRQRIRSTQSLKKIFRAMELIAASRIGRARERATSAAPYSRAITRAVSALATHTNATHPLLSERKDSNRAAVLVIASDRGMAGAYAANAIREAERVITRLEQAGREVDVYAVGRRAVAYYQFRDRPLARTWVGSTDSPTPDVADSITEALLASFTAEAGDGEVGELHIVFTQFVNMVTQRPRVVRMLPLEVVDGVEPIGSNNVAPLYEFEPSIDQVIDALLPRYVNSRIYTCLLQSAASELAARQRAMKTATDNAEDLIRMYTRLANQARQSEITQEISEIVSGADALAS